MAYNKNITVISISIIILFCIFLDYYYFHIVLNASYHCKLASTTHQLSSQPCIARFKQNDQTHINGYPKIVHRIYGFWDKGNMSEEWRHNCYNTCHEDTLGFTRIMWNKTSVLTLLQNHYPWFLDTFLLYPYEVQRVDAARYFILHHYGGLYMDMDLSCKSGNHSLIHFIRDVSFMNSTDKGDFSRQPTNAVLVATTPKPIVSNYLMLSQRCDPYMMYAISQLPCYNNWYFVPYMTVMFSTGGIFLTQVLYEFESKSPQAMIYRLGHNNHVVYRLPEVKFWEFIGESGKHGTWHYWDAKYFLYFYFSFPWITMMLLLVLLGVVLLGYYKLNTLQQVIFNCTSTYRIICKIIRK